MPAANHEVLRKIELRAMERKVFAGTFFAFLHFTYGPFPGLRSASFLLGDKTWGRFDRYLPHLESKAEALAARDQLQYSYYLQVCADHRQFITNKAAQLSPLFRYGLARLAGMDDYAEQCWREPAEKQYNQNPYLAGHLPAEMKEMISWLIR